MRVDRNQKLKDGLLRLGFDMPIEAIRVLKPRAKHQVEVFVSKTEKLIGVNPPIFILQYRKAGK